MIERPALVQIDLANNTKISARAARYSDPLDLNPSLPFVMVAHDGEISYVLGAAIARLSVFPLDTADPAQPAAKGDTP